jgi:hypothetical protein
MSAAAAVGVNRIIACRKKYIGRAPKAEERKKKWED